MAKSKINRLRYVQIYDGDWVRPDMHDYRSKCCKCDLVHKMEFRVVNDGGRYVVEYRCWRLPIRK